MASDVPAPASAEAPTAPDGGFFTPPRGYRNVSISGALAAARPEVNLRRGERTTRWPIDTRAKARPEKIIEEKRMPGTRLTRQAPDQLTQTARVERRLIIPVGAVRGRSKGEIWDRRG